MLPMFFLTLAILGFVGNGLGPVRIGQKLNRSTMAVLLLIEMHALQIMCWRQTNIYMIKFRLHSFLNLDDSAD